MNAGSRRPTGLGRGLGQLIQRTEPVATESPGPAQPTGKCEHWFAWFAYVLIASHEKGSMESANREIEKPRFYEAKEGWLSG